MSPAPQQHRTGATLAIVSLALFMVVLDNLVVTVALPAIRADLGATLQSLEWTINAYTLAFAVTLIPGAALGDRFGRKRLFLGGLALFTVASAAAALAPTTGALVVARAVQGIGGAVVAPLTLTLLADAFPVNRRGAALGIWSGISGTGIALGPIVGGAVVDGISWHWIFWINVPIGLALLPVAAVMLRESHGPSRTLDLPGFGLATTGLFSLVFGLVRGQAEGWTSPLIVASLAAGVALLGAFLAWERRAQAPMVPLGLFRKRTFAVTNAISFFMYFGTFGSIFLLTQILQYVLGYTPFQAGLRMLVWTGATMVVAPIAGVLAERYGSRGFMASGLALQATALAWFAATTSTTVTFGDQAIAFALAGIGMGLVFAPSASALLSVVNPAQAGQASGTNNAIREVGGVFGVAVLSTIFSGSGALSSPQGFVDGAVPALWVAAAGSAAFFALAPGATAGLIPWWLTGWDVRDIWAPARVAGALLLAAGAIVLISAFVRFVVEGLGTPAPVAPTEHLVVGGLYRYVRNPMYVAVATTIIGQALLLGQLVLLPYAALFLAVTATFVRLHEEPALRRRYGAQYDAYRRAVPGWWPRLSPRAPDRR